MVDWHKVPGQVIATIILGVFLTCGMAAIEAFHSILDSFLSQLGSIGAFFVVFLSLTLFVGLLWASFKWVQTAGFGLFLV